MAKQTLPVNFKDDILASSMGGKRKYRIIDNGDGIYSFEDVTEYTQTGSDFGAGQINATNQAVNESCDKADVIDDLEDVVANQANGKIAGAKAVATLNAYLSDLNSSLGKYSKAFTNAIEQYETEERIRFKQSDTPLDDIDDTIASFGDDGIVTINRDMTALINVCVNGKWAGLNKRCWIYLRDRNADRDLTQSIQYGDYTTCMVSTVQKLSAGQQLEVITQEAFAINNGLSGTYIEIIYLYS